MTQCQRASYRVAAYFIINNVTTATLDSKMKDAWKRRWQKRNWNSLKAFIWAFRILSKMTARSWIITPSWPLLSLFLRFLFKLNFVLSYGFFSLRFCMEMIWNWIIRIDSWFFSFVEVWVKKKKKKKKKKPMAGCSSKTCFIPSIFRLLCIALWHYVREHIIYAVYSDCVLVFAFAFLSCKKKNLL